MFRFQKKKGFTLVEILVVVLIMGLLISLAIPNFLSNRRKTRDKLCQNNLRLIRDALVQYKMTEKLPNGVDVNPVYLGVIVGSPTAFVKEEPFCPIGNRSYNVTTFEALPTCPNRDEIPADKDYVNHTL